MKLAVTLERDETGVLVAECPAIPGCESQGRTEDEALANVREAIAACSSRAGDDSSKGLAIGQPAGYQEEQGESGVRSRQASSRGPRS